MTRELLNLHIGQAGCQIGESCWELFCAEHDIDSAGLPRDEAAGIDEAAGTFFQETESGKMVPRALFLDLEPTVVDEIRFGECRELYHPDQLLSGFEDAANCWARGHCTIGNEIIETAMDCIRRLADACDSLQGFAMYLATAGGTGSGLGSLILRRLNEEYGRLPAMVYSIYPSRRMAQSVVEPYNTVLATSQLVEYAHVVYMMDNESVMSMMRHNLAVPAPTYTNLNRLIGQVISSLTASMRFDGEMNVQLDEVLTNLVPYQTLHFLVPSFAPIISAERAMRERQSVQDITLAAFRPENHLAAVEPSKGRYISCALLYRGDVVPRSVHAAAQAVKSKGLGTFVDWVPTGFKCGINGRRMHTLPHGDIARVERSVCCIANTTAIQEAFHRVAVKFDLLYSKKAFVHWYEAEGMDATQLMEAREDLAALEADYNEAGLDALTMASLSAGGGGPPDNGEDPGQLLGTPAIL